MSSTAGTRASSKSSLLTLPNELLIEVAPHLKSFKDLNSLVRTSRLFHCLFNSLLYRRAVTANVTVREDIVRRVLHLYRAASLALLLDNGLSIHQEVRRDGQGMLHEVCYLDLEEPSIPLARLLLERGADVHAKKSTLHFAPLHVAASQSKCEIAKLLLAHGADVNATGAYECDSTPLHVAAIGYQPEVFAMVKLLLQAGADVNALTSDGRSPLWLAYIYDLGRIGTLLLAHGADTDAVYRIEAPSWGSFTIARRERLDQWLKRWAPSTCEDDNL
jgi:cytochrome c